MPRRRHLEDSICIVRCGGRDRIVNYDGGLQDIWLLIEYAQPVLA